MRLGKAKNRNAKTSMVNKAVHFIVGGGLPITPTPPTVKWPAVLAMEVCEVRFFAFPALVFRAVVWNVGACQITTKRTNTNCDGPFSLRVSFQVRGARGPF